MATTFYISSRDIGVVDVGSFLARLARGAAATGIQLATVAGGTWVSFGLWATPPLAAFTLSGVVTMNLRGLESSTQANVGLGLRVYRWSPEAGIGPQLVQISNATELTTAEVLRTGTGTPPSTVFNHGDVLVFEPGLIAAGGTMAGNRTGTLFFDGPTAGASGDSHVTITENVTLHRRVRSTT